MPVSAIATAAPVTTASTASSFATDSGGSSGRTRAVTSPSQRAGRPGGATNVVTPALSRIAAIVAETSSSSATRCTVAL